MPQKLGQYLKQTQNLMMTPQLQQAIKLLTLTHLEMTTVIATEMVENPLLEETGGEGQVELSPEEERNREATAEDFSGPELIDNGKNDFDWEKYVESFNNHSSTPRSLGEFSPGDEMPSYENMVSRSQSLEEHLEWQLRMEGLPQNEFDFGLKLIHHLKRDGYFEIPFAEICQGESLSLEDCEKIQWTIQRLDPAGCACETLEDCLLAQARALESRSPLAEILIREHLENLRRKDYTKIMQATGVDQDKIKHAEHIVLSLNPKPGMMISAEETQYIVPDIFVREQAGEFVVLLNDDGVPSLKISNLYKSLLKKKDENPDEKAKEYVQDKLRAAMWLIKSIENRQRTIEKVAKAIVKYQPEFFRKGPQFIKPMILKDIAQEIGMHESTVSRVTTNKFMHTAIGTFELKYFFSTGIGGKNGGIDIASESLKLKIKKLIEMEDRRRPLSDQKIVQLLKEEDVVVARRTIAKYREMLNIPSSAERKIAK